MTKNTFSTKIDLSLKEKLQNYLISQNFEITKPKYTIFSAKKKGITCVLYESGTLLVQGKNKNDFIEFYLEPEILKSFEYTHPEIHENMSPHIGVDEAGKGDFFGPLCTASLFADEKQIKELIKLGVKDSKRFSDSSILKLAEKIKKQCSYHVISIYPEKYNELYKKFKNLNFLLGWAHASAIYYLHEKTKCKDIYIDQFANKKIVQNAILKKQIKINLNQKHKGESDIVVAGASILARAYFLEGLKKLEDKYEVKLPKGASSKVIEAGISIAKKMNLATLGKVAKLHFKTYRDIQSQLE